MMKHIVLALLLMLFAAPVRADDAAQEARAVALGNQLRCVVCQSETINDSQAEMARDLRKLVRDKIAAGESDEQILQYARARYGDFILLRPPVQPNTLLLWLLPLLLIGGGGYYVRDFIRQRGKGRAR